MVDNGANGLVVIKAGRNLKRIQESYRSVFSRDKEWS